jgi:hypothetical protein
LIPAEIRTILKGVKTKHCKPLHYLLIILLMLAPLRSAMAVQLASCDMAAMDMEESPVSIPAAMVVSMKGHDMHHMSSHGMSGDQDTSAQTISDQAGSAHRCCCCDNGCKSNCDMGMSASLIIQASAFSPVFLNASSFSALVPATLVRALTPPSRPPASSVI